MQLTVTLTPTQTPSAILARLALDDQQPIAVSFRLEEALQGGEVMFQALFASGDAAQAVWAKAGANLENLRITIIEDGENLPWETLRVPGRQVPLAVAVNALTRTRPGAVPAAALVGAPVEKLRILYVLPRLRGNPGSVYQSIGLRILNGLCLKCREYFTAEVLDPPFYAYLEERLAVAQAEGQPFHVVHYDGTASETGELVFDGIERPEQVPAGVVGKLLARQSVRVFSLNQALFSPGEGDLGPRVLSLAARSLHASGVPGVIITAGKLATDRLATFLANIYAGLAQGGSLGELVSSERRLWYGKSLRIEDEAARAEWLAPVVYEMGAVTACPRLPGEAGMILRVAILDRQDELIPELIDRRLAQRLYQPGVFDRAGVVMQLWRALDFRTAVLLWGPLGSGKSTAAAELARWLTNAGLLAGQPVIYTSLEACTSFSDVLEGLGQVYNGVLRERHIEWAGLDDFQKQKLILDVLKKVPLFWVWDDFEQAARGGSVLWDPSERGRLAEFLRAAPEGAGRILVISQNEEQELLGGDFLRLAMPTGLKAQPLGVERRMGNLSEGEVAAALAASQFSGVLNSEALKVMGKPGAPWALAGMSQLAGEILDQLAQQGWLSRLAGRYWQPLADLWALRHLANGRFGEKKLGRAFVEGMAAVSKALLSEYRAGIEDVTELLVAEQTNLARATVLAHQHGWKNVLIDLLEGFSQSCQANGMVGSEWRVLELVTGDYLDLEKKHFKPGRINDAQRLLALREGNALRRGKVLEAAGWLEWRVQYKASRLKPADPVAFERLAGLLAELGQRYQQAGHPRAVDVFVQAYRGAASRQMARLAMDFAYQIAGVYLSLPGRADPQMSETWVHTALDWAQENDLLARARAEQFLGQASTGRFRQACKENRSEAEKLTQLNAALIHFHDALELVPEQALLELGGIYEGLGYLYIQSSAGLEDALGYYHEAARVKEDGGDRLGAATTRFNAAVALFLLGEFERGSTFARQALEGFEALGADGQVQKTRGLLARFPEVRENKHG